MMRRTCRVSGAVLAVLIPALSVGPARGEEPQSTKQAQASSGGKIYTAYNLWYEKPEKIYSINYKRGGMLPAGTELSSVEVGSKRAKRPFVRLITAKDDAPYTIYIQKKFHPGVTVERFKERMVTNKPLHELTEGLTEKEIEAIKQGRLVVGMSKEAVLICRGYPPEHKTPSVEANQWLYWEDRFRTKAVHFDKTGRTQRPEITETEDDL